MNKKLSIVLIVLLSVLLVAVVGVMVLLFRGDFDLGKFSIAFGESKTLVEEKEMTNIKKLNIESNRADVTIETKAEYNSIKVELYSDYAEEYEITEKEDEIKVVLKDRKITMFGTKGSRIKIYVPETYDKDVVINNRTGDISVGELANSNFNIKLTTGDVKVSKANEMIISLTTGDIEIDNAKMADISSVTGDVEIGNIDVVKIKLTTGDIELDKVNTSLNLVTTTGDVIIIDANLKSNSSINTGTGDVRINNTTGCYIESKTNTGDSRINNNDRKSDIVLTITTRTGDIRVN